MYILHIETSTKVCSVAISHGRELLYIIDAAEGMNHTALLAPAIDRLLKSVSLVPDDLSAIAVSSGPGSYTGLRVGASTAKAMAYSLQVPILVVPSLFALASAAFERHPVATMSLPMIDARRNEVYTALYNRQMDQLLAPFSLILDENLAEFVPPGQIIICGDGASKTASLTLTPSMITDTSIQSSAANLIGPAYEMYMKNQHMDPMHFVPFYLKPPNITKPRTQG